MRSETIQALEAAQLRRRQANAQAQEEDFRAEWERSNAHLAGRAKEEVLEFSPKTQFEQVLAAARLLPQPFTESELVVQAWKMWPRVFGLALHELNYPSDRKVVCTLCGKRGLVARGWLLRVGTGRYSLTEAKV